MAREESDRGIGMRDGNMYESIKREVHRTIGAQQILTESLMLIDALSMQHRAPTSFTLSIKDILCIMRFEQVHTWLCPWGLEYVDETHRTLSRELPAIVAEKFRKIDEEFFHGLPELPQRYYDEILNHSRGLFVERVFLDYVRRQHLDCLSGLKNHPVEELHIRHGGPLRKKDIEAIAQSRTLRVVTIEGTKISKGVRKHLKLLGHLDILFYDVLSDPSEQIKELRWFPNVKSMMAYSPVMQGPYFYGETSAQLVQIIRERRHTLENFDILLHIEPDMADALKACTKMRSFTLDSRSMTDYEIAQFFGDERLQSTLENVSLVLSEAGPETCVALSSCKNLRKLNVSGTKMTSADLSRVLRGCAKAIREVEAKWCNNIDNDILDAIAGCTYLERIDLRECIDLEREALKQYIAHRRRNYVAIWYGPEYKQMFSANGEEVPSDESCLSTESSSAFSSAESAYELN